MVSNDKIGFNLKLLIEVENHLIFFKNLLFIKYAQSFTTFKYFFASEK